MPTRQVNLLPRLAAHDSCVSSKEDDRTNAHPHHHSLHDLLEKLQKGFCQSLPVAKVYYYRMRYKEVYRARSNSEQLKQLD
jgi:hypothetical protein